MKLNEAETTLLVDTLDQAIEGHMESYGLTVADPSLPDLDTLIEVTGDTVQTIKTLQGIREKVLHG